MASYRVRLEVGERIVLPSGYALVTELTPDGYTVSDAVGLETHIAWTDLGFASQATDAHPRYHHVALQPLLDSLDNGAAAEMWDWLERIQTIVTGYAFGHVSLARDGEPFYPYGPGFGVSLDRRCEQMAAEMTRDRQGNRALVRRAERGEIRSLSVSKSTVRNKLRAFEQGGVAALVDGRRIRRTETFDQIAPTFRGEIADIISTLDGDRSTISHREILRQARVRMKKNGATTYAAPQRATAEYVSWLMSSRGRTTRAQRSNALRQASAHSHFAAIHPGQVVAIDVTRADVLVWDPTHERPFSVEIITAIDVATRVVVALRVVPMSADGVDAGLILYDILRPFSMRVDGTEVGHWRWVGVPGAIDLSGSPVSTENGPLAGQGQTLQGDHAIPAVVPIGIRVDHGSIFVGAHFRALLIDFGIDLLLSRGARPTDNATLERLHETYQRAYQALPGFKGRSVSGRGRKVGQEPLCTAAQLQEHLRRWVALDYHRSWHSSLILPDAPKARMTPLDYFDALVSAVGSNLTIPQTGQLLYQFLPVRWGTIRHAGVEFEDLVYDSPLLDSFRAVRRGQFRAKDRAMPFFYDPHDISRVWWSDPDTGLVYEVPWKGAAFLDAPMTDLVLHSVRARIKDRGGNLSLNKQTAQRQILDELTELSRTPSTREWRARISAAARRVETSAGDHAEAQEAQAAGLGVPNLHHRPVPPGDKDRAVLGGLQDDPDDVSMWVDEWPDLNDSTGEGR